VCGLHRIGKRIAFELSGELFVVLHLMVAGRLSWRRAGAAIPRKSGLAALDFDCGTLLFTESSSRKRASLHVVGSPAGLADFDRGGIEPLEATAAQFKRALLAENRTLKRALTDPRIISGIGNAYSDEILHRARLSPVMRTQQLDGEQLRRLRGACRETLREWTDRLRAEAGTGFPERVTAFHAEMAVHGKYRAPCPVCGTAVQRIRHATNEVNYCPRCQTGGRVLADRALSRLLKSDWPRRIEELEERLGQEPPGRRSK
jgi:formamidopyrimidine-DNA glycosylase